MGRAMFGMLSALAELQREFRVANTRDELAPPGPVDARGAGAPSSRPTKPC